MGGMLCKGGLTACYLFSRGSTDVFICTSPIKKYRYCPYEKVSGSETPSSEPPCASLCPAVSQQQHFPAPAAALCPGIFSAWPLCPQLGSATCMHVVLMFHPDAWVF